MNLMLPENLDVREMFKNNPPKFKPFKIDKACFLLHLINHVKDKNDIDIEDGFTNLSATQMQKIVHNYNDYWKYFMHDLKIVIRNDSYFPKNYCKSFSFVDEYQTPIKKIDWIFKDASIQLQQKLAFDQQNKKNKPIKYITKWFDDGKLKLDTKFALDINQEIYEQKKDNKGLWDYNPIKKRIKNPLKQRDHAYKSIYKMTDNFAISKRDDNVKRLHTPLTSMNKLYRNLLTYAGEPINALDLTNSQMFLGIKLLTQDYLIIVKDGGKKVTIDFESPFEKYKKITRKKTIDKTALQNKINTYYLRKKTNNTIGENSSPIKNKTLKTMKPTTNNNNNNNKIEVEVNGVLLNNKLNNKLNNIVDFSCDCNFQSSSISSSIVFDDVISSTLCTDNQSSFIMLGLFAETPINSEFQEYMNLAIGGKFYEKMQEKIQQELGHTYESRDDVKVEVFKFLFSKVGRRSKFVKLFQQLFPEVYDIFYEIKKDDNSILPRVLQQIESSLMIDKIAKRISIEHPKAPIFTIHDCLATTEKNIAAFQKIMQEEFLKDVGYTPDIKEEKWRKENVYKHLDALIEKSHKLAS